jgi:hypothetical protein
MASLSSSWSWIVIMAAGALLFVIAFGVKTDAYPCRRCDTRHRHGEMVPYAWIRNPGWFHVVAGCLSGQRHNSFLACHHYCV